MTQKFKTTFYVAIDSSVLIGLLNVNDHRHLQAKMLYSALAAHYAIPIYFDCVISESLSAVIRRIHEKKLPVNILELYAQLDLLVSQDDITWVFPEIPTLYASILELMHSSAGALNFHDALIALACQQRKISTIASFDRDFDEIAWLRRIENPNDL